MNERMNHLPYDSFTVVKHWKGYHQHEEEVGGKGNMKGIRKVIIKVIGLLSIPLATHFPPLIIPFPFMENPKNPASQMV